MGGGEGGVKIFSKTSYKIASPSTSEMCDSPPPFKISYNIPLEIHSSIQYTSQY